MRDLHYKIADRRAMGYISVHAHGQPHRRSRFLDCRMSPERNGQRLFGACPAKREAAFAAAETA